MALITREYQEFQDYRDRLEERLLDGCIFRALDGIEDRAHPGIRCKRALVKSGWKVAEAQRLALRMDRFLRQRGVVEKFGCCLGCFVPQEFCNA